MQGWGTTLCSYEDFFAEIAPDRSARRLYK